MTVIEEDQTKKTSTVRISQPVVHLNASRFVPPGEQ
jgi:hypothetical protein